jgi:chromosome segregation ATPase
MKTTTGIFFFILISIFYVASAQKAFTQVRTLLANLKASNQRDQQQANVREAAERAWCTKEIDAATKLLASRQHDVDSLEAHINWIIKTRDEARKDRKTRQERIKANNALLAKFKSQRCDNNLLFVKQLREHMQGVQVLTLLRGDIVAYFNKKPSGQRGTFIEQFEEYAVLLDAEHKQVFTELKNEITNLDSQVRKHALDRGAESQIATRADADVNAQGARLTAQQARTAQQIGTGHVDNKRGELKKLETPAWENISDFNKKARARILGLIDGLIRHLRESRRRLTRDEIHAAEDFAIFHNSMERENEYLEKKIRELTKEIVSLTNQLNVARVQLVKRKNLRDQARAALDLLKKMCEEKYAYFTRETARRNNENKTIDLAISKFNHILNNLSKRVRGRASASNEQGFKGFGDNLGHRVVDSDRAERADLAQAQKERAAVVF